MLQRREGARGCRHDFSARRQGQLVHRFDQRRAPLSGAVALRCANAGARDERTQFRELDRAGAQPDAKAFLDVFDVRQRLGGDEPQSLRPSLRSSR